MNEIFIKIIKTVQAQTTPSNITTTIEAIAGRATNVLKVTAYVLAILFTIIAGIFYITSLGSGQVKKAHTMLLWIAVGIAIILLSSFIISLVQYIINP